MERRLYQLLPGHAQFAWLDKERALVLCSSVAAATNLLRNPPGAWLPPSRAEGQPGGLDLRDLADATDETKSMAMDCGVDLSRRRPETNDKVARRLIKNALSIGRVK